MFVKGIRQRSPMVGEATPGACRAMLLGLLLPDPCDEYCPEEFKQQARELLPKVQGQVGPKDEDLRKSLLKFIGDFANWDLCLTALTWKSRAVS